MKLALFVPVDETQQPIEIAVKKVEIEGDFYAITLPDGSGRLLPKAQVKELRLLDGDTDHWPKKAD